MIPVVFINCSRFPFLSWILNRSKLYETRTRDTLRALVGQRVYLAETGHGRRAIVKSSARIAYVFPVISAAAWQRLRPLYCVPSGSQYDWRPGTRIKYMYVLEDVRNVAPFPVPEGVRHGRVWMEYIPANMEV